jgi:hypothetical protein
LNVNNTLAPPAGCLKKIFQTEAFSVQGPWSEALNENVRILNKLIEPCYILLDGEIQINGSYASVQRQLQGLL